MESSRITQEEVDDDQAYWCSQIVWPEYQKITPRKELDPPLESYKFVIFDISDKKEE